MSRPFLSRRALTRVLRSLLLAELRAARGRREAYIAAPSLPVDWPDDLPLGEGGLGCDSLDLLSLAAAVNEMFHLHEVGTERNLLEARHVGDWLDGIEAAWRGGVSQLTFATSGSTGRPKRCVQPMAHLATEIDALVARWPDRGRVLALAPAHHIYGFIFTALLPDRLAVPCRLVAEVSPAALAADIRSDDLVVSFPERWAYLARSLPAWPAGLEGVVSTAPCDPDLLADLADRGLSRMTEVYGSSETAGIAWRDAPEQPYDLMPQWRFAEPHDDDAPTLVHAAGTTHALMDRIVRAGHRSFRLDGRRDGMVQVGGVNVSPTAVAERLRRRPGVRHALVRLMRVEEGRRLKAYLVPKPDVDGLALCEGVAAWAAAYLSAAERPGAFTSGEAPSADVPVETFDW